jgi:hypothetical protein
MNVIERIDKVLAGQNNDPQLDKYLSEVRESLTGSNRQFLTYQALILSSLVTYYLVVYGRSPDISVYGFAIHDASLFRRVFLIVPAALLAAMACVGYLRRLQREVYDYLTISRYSVLGTTGLHELRLPGDFLLGLFLLGIEGGPLGKLIRFVVTNLCIFAFVGAPTAYVLMEAVRNIETFGRYDVLCVLISIGAIILSACGLLVVFLAGRIEPT